MSEKDRLLPDVLVRLRKSGGIIPVEHEWLFYADGTIRHPNGEITKLEEKSFQTLLDKKKIDTLADLDPDYPPPVGSADFVTMELTAHVSSGIFKTRAADSSDLVPDKLWDFWDELQDAAKRSLAASTKK